MEVAHRGCTVESTSPEGSS